MKNNPLEELFIDPSHPLAQLADHEQRLRDLEEKSVTPKGFIAYAIVKKGRKSPRVDNDTSNRMPIYWNRSTAMDYLGKGEKVVGFRLVLPV
jgi:hypothetical protein